MAALCGPCNLKKGAHMPKELRAHQRELPERAKEIVAGTITDRSTVANITPGGGKSLAASLFARVLLDAGIVDRVCWITPRTSLASQASEGFRDEDLNPAYRVRRADNTPPLVRDQELGCVGYTTTYQAVAANPQLHSHEFSRHRYLLILDEPHHLADEDGKPWAGAVRPLVEKSIHALLMTGTIERNDKSRIPFIDYAERDGRMFPATHVEYGRRMALAERAVLEMKFTYQDGWAHFCDGGDERRVEISKASDEDVSKVIATFLGRTDYREALLRRGIDQWLAYTASEYPSRAIVICASQSMAKDVREFVTSQYKVQVALAISEDADSQRTLRQFRHGKRGQVLVTVGMAYEGLDVPDCSHLICLTNTRSVSWLEQAFARVTRPDYKAMKAGVPYERQFGFLYVPDDPRMRAVVERMRIEQAEGIADRAAEEKAKRESAQRQEKLFASLGANEGAVNFGTLDGRMSPEDAARIQQIQSSIKSLSHVPADDVLRAVRMASGHVPASNNTTEVRIEHDEATLRKQIQTVASSRDRINRLSPGTTNGLARRHFGKSREEMGTVELRAVLAWMVALDDEEVAS
jgi:superfamily II DNA or RNA helicase